VRSGRRASSPSPPASSAPPLSPPEMRANTRVSASDGGD
jgi:hypothetical protein